jgi:hypothetical protein
MHIYVNGQEQTVYTTYGEANPTGVLSRQNEIYIGHDSICTIDELKISNTVNIPLQPIWFQWWLWVTIIFVTVLGSGLMLHFKKRNF